MDLKLKNNSQLTLPLLNRVEYIETNGYPNINTGIKFPDNVSGTVANRFRIEADIEILSGATANFSVYLASTGAANRGWFGLVYKIEDDAYTVYNQTTSATTTQVTVSFAGRVKIIQSMLNRGSSTSNYIEINGIKTTTPAGVNSATLEPILYLFNSGNVTLRVWSYKIFKGDVLVRNYVPVISVESGHIGEAALYDLVNNKYYYSKSTGSFTASHPQGLYDVITSAYVKDCPNISGINLLRGCININRVRLDIGTQSGTVAELYKYAAYAGFNDAYENQTKPRIIGSFTVDNILYTNAEITQLSNDIDGITIIPPEASYNIDTILENDDFACQVLDSEKSNYNPAVAIRLANTCGKLLNEPFNEGGGRWCLSKNMSAAFGMALRGMTTVVDTNKVVSDDDEAEYTFENFEEFQYFTGFTSISGSSTSPYGAFAGCTSLKKIILPSQVTSIETYAFYNCTSLEQIVIPASVTSIDAHAFYNCTSITNIDARNATVSNQGFNLCGNGQGTLKIGKIRGTTNNNAVPKFKHILMYIGGTAEANHACIYGSYVYTIRINGDFNTTSNHNSNTICASSTTNVRFIELTGSYTGTSYGYTFAATTGLYNGCIMHLGNTAIAGTPTKASASQSRLVKIYVGDGSSKAADEAVFALYNADANWTTYCGSGVPGDGKVDLWWNYNGTYKWYYITDNLTNCTNTNPDEWPHITRGEEYRTTIVADEGYTLGTVKVEMYFARDNSPTPDEPTDITSTVYDASTGEIYINSVMGNIIITASAN